MGRWGIVIFSFGQEGRCQKILCYVGGGGIWKNFAPENTKVGVVQPFRPEVN